MVNNNYSTDGGTTWKTLVGHPIYPGNSFVAESYHKHHLSLIGNMTLSTYNPTTEIFNSAYIAQPGNTYRGGYQHFCCSSDAKYVYVIFRQAIDLRAIIIQRSSDYGVSYTKFLLKQPL
jgi:hypothetical protein